MSVCNHIGIGRCRLCPGKKHGRAFRSYIAGKKHFFSGPQVHLGIATSGLPVEVMLGHQEVRQTSPHFGVCDWVRRPKRTFAGATYLDQNEETLPADA